MDEALTGTPSHDASAHQGQLAIVKPRVLGLLVFSGLTGFLLATTQEDATWEMLMWLMVGGILATASANIFNNILDRERDSLMERTMWRPLPAGRVSPKQAGYVAVVLGLGGLAVMYLMLNPLTAALTLAGMLFYIIVYTHILKPITTENITIGGVAGAFPPLVGWTAVTGTVDLPPLHVGLLVILWTPPHFWSLALFHQEDYQRAGVPMLPVVKGERTTHRRIVAYTVALVLASFLFVYWEELFYGYYFGIIVLNTPMLALALRLAWVGGVRNARMLFHYSNFYLMALLLLLILDTQGVFWERLPME
ncbi:MAG: protoheme IX farnesyltransferase [Thermoplasmata archaeon]|nr:MAG: protoheme IX farnesyltransferase [Thermoplasmata archaeon]